MANVINRKTKQYIGSVNTPDYPSKEWIVNPELPDCDVGHYIIVGDIVREMDRSEKDDLEYSTRSSVYLISKKQLLKNINGHDYQSDPDAIINPSMPDCKIRYTKVVNSNIVEMDTEEKYEINYPVLKQKWISNIKNEIFKSHSVEMIALFSLLISTGYIDKTNEIATEMQDVIVATFDKFPKP